MSRKKSKAYLVRFTDEEFSKFEKMALDYKVTKQSLLTSLLSLSLPPPPLSDDFYSILKELRYIGNNLNQIARVANSTGDIHYDEYMNYYKLLVKEILNIKQAIAKPIPLDKEVIPNGDNKNMGNQNECQ